MIDLPQPEIVVTARALPPGRGEASQGVVVIGREALERSPGMGLDQIVRAVPGVQLFRRSDSRSANPTSQGVTLRGLGGNAASRAIVILDGLVQSDPFGGWVNWPALDPAGLAEVRVTRGAGGVGFGPGALAGTVELTSERTSGLRAAMDLGHHGAAEARLAVAGGAWTVAAWGGQDRGFVPVVREDRGPADRRAPFAFGGVRSSLRVGVFELGTALFADVRERGLEGAGNSSRGADLWLRWRLPDRASFTLFHQQRRFASDFANAIVGRAASVSSLRQRVPAQSSGWSGEWRPDVGPAVEFRLGADGRLATGRSEEEASFVAGSPTRTREAKGRQATAGLFADIAAELGPAQISAGARIDRWWLSGLALDERAIASGASFVSERAPDRQGLEPGARLGLRVPMGPDLTLRASAYRAWRLPTLNELVRPFRAGRDAVAANFALRPERLRGIEAGAEWRGGPWSASMTLFSNRLAHPIVNVSRGVGPGLFPQVGFVAGTFRQRDNVAAIRSRGVEADVGWRRGDWRVSGALALTDARVRDTGPLGGRRPAQVPARTATAELGWRELSLFLRHVGRQAEDDLGTISLPAATTVDASAAWPIGRNLSLSFRGENLLNARVLAARGSDGVDERATPRRLWLGLRLRR